jgi:hypothetical protein
VVHLTVLAVPGCPGAGLLEERIACVLGSRRDVTVSRHVITDEQEQPAGECTARRRSW